MKFLKLDAIKEKSVWQHVRLAVTAAVVVTFACTGMSSAAVAPQKSFSSAEEAVKAAVAAARSNNDKELLAIFGAQAKELLYSGDPMADKQRRAQFLKAYDEKNRLVAEKENTIVVIGNNDWPFPIPLVKKGAGWVFDPNKGREEILNRRIGDNELNAIQVMLAIVDAQRDYAMKDRDGDGILEYAQRFRSEAGKKNGLYWEAKAGDEPSPLGPIVAQAQKAGYAPKQQVANQTAAPYHGYFYRIVNAQGKSAPGGAFSYLVKGNMLGGFAIVAYPAQYRNSGVMTLIVNHAGVVYEKNLGKDTATIAQKMSAFDPDKTWNKVASASQ